MKKLKSRRGFEAWRDSGKGKKEAVGKMLSRLKIETLSGCNRFQSANLKNHITLSWWESVRRFLDIHPCISTAPRTGITSRWSQFAGCLLPPGHEGAGTEWYRGGWACEQLQGPLKPLPYYWQIPKECLLQTFWRLVLHFQMHKCQAEASSAIKWETHRAGALSLLPLLPVSSLSTLSPTLNSPQIGLWVFLDSFQ